MQDKEIKRIPDQIVDDCLIIVAHVFRLNKKQDVFESEGWQIKRAQAAFVYMVYRFSDLQMKDVKNMFPSLFDELNRDWDLGVNFNTRRRAGFEQERKIFEMAELRKRIFEEGIDEEE